MQIHNFEYLKHRRKFLRNNPTNAEKLLWLVLKNKQTGYKFRRQQSIGIFIMDFYCHKLRLVIEVDGATHDIQEVKEKDRIKEKYLKDNYLEVIRFTDDQIFGNIEKVFDEIKEYCKEIERGR